MTVNTSTQSVTYNGDGSTTSFPIPFYFLLNEDIQAALVINNVGTPLVFGSDFDLSGAGAPNGGTLTMFVAPKLGSQLVIDRQVAITQQREYQQNDPFPAKTTEKALDKLTMICQQLFATLGGYLPDQSRVLMLGRYDVNGSGAYRANSNRIRDLGDPTADQDATNRRYVQAQDDIVKQYAASLYTQFVDSVRGFAELAEQAAAEALQQLRNVYPNSRYFFGDGVTKTFDLGYPGIDARLVSAYITGLYQQSDAYTVGSDGRVTFSEAPPEPDYPGEPNIEFRIGATVAQAFAIPSDQTVTDAKVWTPGAPSQGVDSAKLKYAQSGAIAGAEWTSVQAKLAELDASMTLDSVNQIKLRPHTVGVVALRGRPGLYEYTEVDYSAAALLDTLGGAVVKSSVLPGFWIKKTPILSAQDFGAPLADVGTDSYIPISVGIAVASALGWTWNWRGNLATSAGIQIPGGLNVSAETESTITQYGNANIEAVFESMRDQDGRGIQDFPSIDRFPTAWTFKVHGNLKRLRSPRATNCYGAVQFAIGGQGNVLDSIVEISQIANCTAGVNFHGAVAGAICQGTGLVFNFITNTQFPVWFDGEDGAHDGCFADGHAIDMTAARSDGVVLHNSRTNSMGGSVRVPAFRLSALEWFGGDGFSSGAKIADGSWWYLDLQLRMNGISSSWNMLNCLDDGVITRSRVKNIQWTEYASVIAPRAQGLSNFHGGIPLFGTNFNLQCQVPSSTPAGAVTSFWAYNIWGSSTERVWRVSILECPPGMQVTAIANGTGGEIRIDVTNVGADTTSVQNVRLGFNRVGD